MIGKIGNLTLFTSDGENIGTINPESFEIDFDNDNKENIIDEDKKLNFNLFKEFNFEFETNLDLFTYYYLMYGIKMTNNYLKMHGGIMRRK